VNKGPDVKACCKYIINAVKLRHLNAISELIILQLVPKEPYYLKIFFYKIFNDNINIKTNVN